MSSTIPTFIWTWVDTHGHLNVETKAPPAYIQQAPTAQATAYMTVSEHNRILERLRAAARPSERAPTNGARRKR